VVLSGESVGLVFSVVLVTAIFITLAITHCFINIFTAKEDPAAIENYIHMKLFLRSMFLHTCSVNTDNVSDASDLGTVLNSLAVENTVDELVVFAGFVAQSIMRRVNHFYRADVLVVGCFVRKRSVDHNTVNIDLVLVGLQLVKRRVNHLKEVRDS
jgi:hypothetical protein